MLYLVIDVIEDLEGLLSYTLLSILLMTWKVSCFILCYRCYRGLGRFVVLYFIIDVIEDLEGLLRILCYQCYRGLGGLVVLCVVIYAIEDLEGYLSYILLSML